jgi:hypothetical protein
MPKKNKIEKVNNTDESKVIIQIKPEPEPEPEPEPIKTPSNKPHENNKHIEYIYTRKLRRL